MPGDPEGAKGVKADRTQKSRAIAAVHDRSFLFLSLQQFAVDTAP